MCDQCVKVSTVFLCKRPIFHMKWSSSYFSFSNFNLSPRASDSLVTAFLFASKNLVVISFTSHSVRVEIFHPRQMQCENTMLYARQMLISLTVRWHCLIEISKHFVSLGSLGSSQGRCENKTEQTWFSISQSTNTSKKLKSVWATTHDVSSIPRGDVVKLDLKFL